MLIFQRRLKGQQLNRINEQEFCRVNRALFKHDEIYLILNQSLRFARTRRYDMRVLREAGLYHMLTISQSINE